MNVYIGLLGELYEAAEKRSRQLYNHYRASALLMVLRSGSKVQYKTTGIPETRVCRILMFMRSVGPLPSPFQARTQTPSFWVPFVWVQFVLHAFGRRPSSFELGGLHWPKPGVFRCCLRSAEEALHNPDVKDTWCAISSSTSLAKDPSIVYVFSVKKTCILAT